MYKKHPADHSHQPANKRIKHSIPQHDDDDDDDDDDTDALTPIIETFRKEAIYRQMMEYKRAHNRSLARVDELERRKAALEAGLEGVEVCWTELLESIRGLVGSKDLPPVSTESPDYPMDETDLPELTAAIDKRSQSTKELLIQFVQLAERGARATTDELRLRAKVDEKNNATLRSSIKLLQTQLAQAQAQHDQAYADLLKAEKKYDRLRCQSVSGPPGIPPQESTETDGQAPSAPSSLNGGTNGVEVKMKERARAPEKIDPVVVNQSTESAEEDRALAESRLRELGRLREDRMRLEGLVDSLRSEAEHPFESVITSTGLFKQLLAQVAMFKNEANEAKSLFEKLTVEADALRDGRKVFEDTTLDASSTETEALRTQLGKRELDLARLRNQRDEIQGELHEKKTLEHTRLSHADQAFQLVQSKQERIETLTSEVNRLRLKLAAEAGSEGVFQFLLQHLGDESIELTYVEHLESKLRTAEAKMNTLAEQIASIPDGKPDLMDLISSEADAREKLVKAEQRLASFERVLGPDPAVGKDVGKVTKRLEDKQREIEVLDLKVKGNEAAMDALYSEVERLSKAWEEAETLASSKVFNLKEVEDRLAKVSTEKAKADNKYFAAMRAKEALDLEKKAVVRNLEKQVKVLEKLTESEKSLSAMLALKEKEVTILRANVRSAQERVTKLQGEVAEFKVLLESEKARSTELTSALNTRISITEKERAAHMMTQEELAKTKKEVEKKDAALVRSDKSKAGAGGESDSGLQQEMNKLYSILRCSTCQIRMRSHCLTKCMHTFCKDCVDARIQTRQRKCPACNLPFAVSDVQQVYFQ